MREAKPAAAPESLVMRNFRFLAGAVIAFTLTTAPSFAATTYSWPLQISQPLTLSNVAYTSTSQIIVVCGVSNPNVEGEATVPVSAVNGVASYAGNVAVSIAGNSGVAVPVSGATITCTVREKTNGVFTNIGSASSLKLP